MIPLPYALSCVIVAALIGPPAQLLSLYLDTRNINEAFARNAINNGLGIDPLLNTSPLTGNIASFVYFIFIALSLYGTRFMRTRIVAMEKKLLEISPSEETYHRAFGGIIKTKFTILLVAILVPVYAPVQMSVYSGYAYLIFSLIGVPLQGIAGFTFFWMYFRSLWGIYKFGREPLKLKPYYEDRMMGLRPLGSLSLTLALYFFLVWGAVFVVVNVLLPTSIGSIAVGLGFIVLGAVMFFLPLTNIHGKMREEKLREQGLIDKKFIQMRNALNLEGGPNSMEYQKMANEMIAFDIVQRRVASIPTWPFDTSIIQRFVAIVLSVTAILLSRLIQMGLHF